MARCTASSLQRSQQTETPSALWALHPLFGVFQPMVRRDLKSKQVQARANHPGKFATSAKPSAQSWEKGSHSCVHGIFVGHGRNVLRWLRYATQRSSEARRPSEAAAGVCSRRTLVRKEPAHGSERPIVAQAFKQENEISLTKRVTSTFVLVSC